jgi:2-keto-4-pentenoate hydratase/2-oxohepta-3-ene-1,7-dioic acid hydratase in catechol pathway
MRSPLVRFATYEPAPGAAPRAALVEEPVLRPLPEGVTLLGLVEQGADALHAVGEGAAAEGERVPLADVRLLPPLKPPSIRDFVAYEQHIEGMVRGMDAMGAPPDEWYPVPAFYFTNPHCLVGAYDEVEMPHLAKVFDLEAEIGVVIGKAGKNLTVQEAREAIIGFTIFNDWSARDLQKPEKKLGLGFSKGKDMANTLGPYLVTADEVERHRMDDGYLDLTVTVELNGEVIGEDSTASMSWTFEELVVYASRGTWVMPGDVLGSGTCGGGCLGEIWGRRGEQVPPPLTPGDVVTITVEGLGTISNPIVENSGPLVELPPARRRDRGRRH